MTDAATLLAAYDDQLRTDAETPSALSVTEHGPLRLVTFARGRGFVTYRDLDGADAAGIRDLVAAAVAHFTADPEVDPGRVEDPRPRPRAGAARGAPGGRLRPRGGPESIMMGEARLLAVDVDLPEGVTLRTVTDEADVRAMSAMADEAFGDPVSDERAEGLLHRLTLRDGMELWVAEADGRMVSAGRLEPVPHTEVAGIWGGSTLAPWRGRGIYRALTAARARSALRLGKTIIHSDSTEFSRPILERSGFLKVSTTTPYTWRR